MVYCSNCGEKIPDDAYFCFKCGTKTPVGKAAKATYPADELRDAFYQVGIELERAFNIAAKETQAAFKRVSEEMQQKQHKKPLLALKEQWFAQAAEQRMFPEQFSVTAAAQK